MGYTNKTIEGFSWHSLFKFSSAFLSLAKLIILGRLLTPTDFGLFSLTAIALGLSEAATETGVNVVLIRSKKSLSYFIDTAWVISILRGVIISLVMVLLGSLMRFFYHEPLLLPLITFAAFVPLIKGLINPIIVKMQKDLSFMADSFYRTSLSLVEVMVTLLLALIWPTVWTLVAGMVASAVFEVVISFVFFKERPRFIYSKHRAQEIFASAKLLNISSALGYLHENIDNMLIGRLVGTTNLGYYQNAYSLSHKPNADLAKSVGHSTLPVFVKIRDDKNRLARGVRKSVSASMLFFIGLSLILLIYPQIVVLFLGQQWQPAVELIRPLTIAGLIQSFSFMIYTLFLSVAQYQRTNRHLAITTLLMVGLIWWLTLNYGLVGGVWGVALSRLLTLPLIWWDMRQVLKINVK